MMGMAKPNNPICNSCFVIRNKLRCATCKHKTIEWLKDNLGSVMIIDDCDCYKAKEQTNEHATP